jgi:hypothetical protein
MEQHFVQVYIFPHVRFRIFGIIKGKQFLKTEANDREKVLET